MSSCSRQLFEKIGKTVQCINCKKYDKSAGECSKGIVKNNSRCEYEPLEE